MRAEDVPLYIGCHRQPRTSILPPTTTKPRRRYSPYYILSTSILLIDLRSRFPIALRLLRGRKAVDKMVSALLLSLLWSVNVFQRGDVRRFLREFNFYVCAD